MSYSNRPSRRADPTIAPVTIDRVTGARALRSPFTPSAYQEAQRNASSEARKRSRKGMKK